MQSETQLHSLFDRCVEHADPVPGWPPAGGIRRCGHWPELLWDIACLGCLRLEMDTGALMLTRSVDLSALRVRDGIARCGGGESALQLLLDQCAALSGSLGDDGLLVIEDAGARPILSLRPVSGRLGGAVLLRTLLRSHGAIGQRITPLPGAGACAGTAIVDRIGHLDAVDDGVRTLDTLELSGRLSLDPRRLRAHGQCLLVDKDLVPCFLDSLVHQGLTMELVAGNGALVQRLSLAPYLARRDGSWLRMHAQGAELRLDIAAIDSAWVVQPADAPTSARELRLYDGDGQAIACLRPWASASPGHSRIWSTLINALMD